MDLCSSLNLHVSTASLLSDAACQRFPYQISQSSLAEAANEIIDYRLQVIYI